MKQGFRQSMAWLHTWTGLVVGWVLFFVFITGTAGYATYELNRWMQPEKPLMSGNMPSASQQFNYGLDWYISNSETQSAIRWSFVFATGQRRNDEHRLFWQTAPTETGQSGSFQDQPFDPYHGQPLAENNQVRATGGGHTLYRMHYILHYMPRDKAILFVGSCTMFMLVAIITGVITHKKIFKEFFTFRPAKGQRSWLDAHNVVSVIALPFFIVITYSGLIFFLTMYMPYAVPLTYGPDSQQIYYDNLYKNSPSNTNQLDIYSTQTAIEKSRELKALVEETEKKWGKNSIGILHIYHTKNDNPATLELIKVNVNRQGIVHEDSSIRYDLSTFQIIDQSMSNINSLPRRFENIMLDLHEGNFADSFLRWIYVISGLLGAVMIATGLVLWTVKRRPKALKAGKMHFGHQLVEKLNTATIAGLPFAIAVYFWANRLIPISFDARANWEVHSMFIAWLLSLIYTILRPIMQGWRELFILASASYLLIPILNFFTTDRHLGITIPHKDWVLVNVEIGFILIGLMLGWAAWKVHKKMTTPIKPTRKIPVKKASHDQENNNEAV